MNFADTLNTKVGDVERPPLLPVGTYRWVVEKIPEQDVVGQGDQYDVINFTLRCLGAEDDVDADALKEFGGDLSNVRMRHSFLFDREDKHRAEQSLYRLKVFLEDHLQVAGAADMSLKEALNASVQHQCLGYVAWRQNKQNPEVQDAEIRRTAPIE